MPKPQLTLSYRQNDAIGSACRLDWPHNRCGKGVLVPNLASA
jgi:hypothetical protein